MYGRLISLFLNSVLSVFGEIDVQNQIHAAKGVVASLAVTTCKIWACHSRAFLITASVCQ